MSELQKRLRKISALKEKMDGVVIFNLVPEKYADPNFFYFTNSAAAGIFYYDFSTALIITHDMEMPRIKKSWIKKHDKMTSLEKAFEEMKGKKIGMDAANISVNLYEKLKKNRIKAVDISSALRETRMRKTYYEIKNIKKACRMTGQTFKEIERENIRRGTERSLKRKIDYIISGYGESAFPTIVASGGNIRIPHHEPARSIIKKPLLIDIGVRHNGYCSDVTRTYGSRWQSLIEKVIEKVEDCLEPGIRAAELDKASREIMGKASRHFITSLGHGIGIEIHEAPFISPKSKDKLEPGMVFTIEPGIYVKNGIRIENDYLMIKNGFRNLTDF